MIIIGDLEDKGVNAMNALPVQSFVKLVTNSHGMKLGFYWMDEIGCQLEEDIESYAEENEQYCLSVSRKIFL